jgi:predicted nucleotidyltransferase
MLQKKVVGISYDDVLEVRKPENELDKLTETGPKDRLLAAMQNVLEATTKHSGLSSRDFGVFGSMLHGFHHPKFSDIDIIIYSGKKTRKLCEMLDELYTNESSAFQNEFETDESTKGKRWRFQNLSSKEFVWHQRRKLIYGLFNDERGHRIIKVEFEPVKDWKEIKNEYDSKIRIVQKGWVKMVARVTKDDDAPFIPSVYDIEPLEFLDGPKETNEVERIVSYIEEFRMQVHKDEAAYIEGNLEEVTTSKGSFYQIALTYCPRYYEQVLKVNALA